MAYATIIVDDPRPYVRRITLNRPEKRNPLSNELRRELFEALEAADRDPEVRVTVIRGAGSCCARYGTNTSTARVMRLPPPGFRVPPTKCAGHCQRNPKRWASTHTVWSITFSLAVLLRCYGMHGGPGRRKTLSRNFYPPLRCRVTTFLLLLI